MCAHRNGKVRAVFASAVAIGAMLLIAGMAPAEILYVDDDAPPGGDGLAWPTAFCCVQDALFLAASAPGSISEIRVGQGTYRPDQDEGGHVTPGDREATFQLVPDLSLRGGYAGYGAPDPDERDIALYETILTGDLAGDDEPGFVNYEENSYHVVSAIACNDTAIIDGFTITAGNADGETNFHRDRGAGFYNNDGYPLTVNCALTLNSAQTCGGAYYNTSGSFPTIDSCSFTTNVSDEGGAIYSGSYSAPIIAFSKGMPPFRRAVGCTVMSIQARRSRIPALAIMKRHSRAAQHAITSTPLRSSHRVSSLATPLVSAGACSITSEADPRLPSARSPRTGPTDGAGAWPIMRII